MKRRILTLLAALGMLTAVSTAATPAAQAIVPDTAAQATPAYCSGHVRCDTGWHDHVCRVTGGTIEMDVRVVWYPDHRFWMAWAFAKDNAGHFHRVATVRWLARSIGGTWVLKRIQYSPDPSESWWIVYAPAAHPEQPHYEMNAARWNGGVCRTQVLN
jgi:hypothetical protein